MEYKSEYAQNKNKKWTRLNVHLTMTDTQGYKDNPPYLACVWHTVSHHRRQLLSASHVLRNFQDLWPLPPCTDRQEKRCTPLHTYSLRAQDCWTVELCNKSIYSSAAEEFISSVIKNSIRCDEEQIVIEHLTHFVDIQQKQESMMRVACL